MKSICDIIIILFFTFNIIPLFNCGVKENKETYTYYVCKENKIETIIQNKPEFTSGKISNIEIKNNVQDISRFLLKGIRKLINSFEVFFINSKGLYFKKSSKFINVKFSNKRVTFKAIFPENFLSLRMLYNTAQEFNKSFTSSSLIDDQDYENKKHSKFFYTSDYKYVIETISKKQQEILSSTLFDSFSHFCTYPNSLLPQYSGLYYLKHESNEYYFLISRNIKALTIYKARLRQYFLNGSEGTAFKTNPMQIINFQLLDNNFIQKYPEGLKVSSQEKKNILKTLENDTKFLAKLNIISYNLVLIFCVPLNNNDEVEESSKTISDLNQHNKFIQFNDNGKNIFVYYGIMDTLYSYDLKKIIKNAIGCISDDTVKDPNEYQKSFMKFITSNVFKSD